MPGPYTQGVFFGMSAEDFAPFIESMQASLARIIRQETVFAADNLITFSKSLGFLDDPAFMAPFNANAEGTSDRSPIWRRYVVAWAAHSALRVEGDLVECACYKGVTARIAADYAGLKDQDRRYWLYDLFEHDSSMPHHPMAEHGPTLYQQVCARFADLPNVTVVKGRAPQAIAENGPDRIAFLHLDLNNAEAEIGTLDLLFDRMSPGGLIVLDDYGWAGYRAQKTAEDAWFAARGYRVLELPTGQGLLIK